MNSAFLMALGRHDSGAVVETLDEKLREVLEAVHRTGKKGTLDLKLSVAPNGERGYTVEFHVAAKAPSLSFGQSFYYVDAERNLTRTPPAEEGDDLLGSGVPRIGG